MKNSKLSLSKTRIDRFILKGSESMRKKLWVSILVTILLLQACSPVAFAVSEKEKAVSGLSFCNSDVPHGGAGSTGRTVPDSLKEQLAMEQVQSDPLNGARQVPKQLNDARWSSTDGWVKMENVVRTFDSNITIHFNYNMDTGEFADFSLNKGDNNG